MADDDAPSPVASDGKKIFQLRRAVTVNAPGVGPNQIETLTFREPKGSDTFKIGMPFRFIHSGGATETIIDPTRLQQYLSRLCDYPAALSDVHAGDLWEMSNWLGDELAPLEKN